MNSYIWIHIWIHINYEFIWFFHTWIHMFHEFIYEFGCTKVPDGPRRQVQWPYQRRQATKVDAAAASAPARRGPPSSPNSPCGKIAKLELPALRCSADRGEATFADYAAALFACADPDDALAWFFEVVQAVLIELLWHDTDSEHHESSELQCSFVRQVFPSSELRLGKTWVDLNDLTRSDDKQRRGNENRDKMFKCRGSPQV